MACSSSSCGCGGACGATAPCTTLSAQRLQQDARSRSGLASLEGCPTYFRDQLASLGTSRLDTDSGDPEPMPQEGPRGGGSGYRTGGSMDYPEGQAPTTPAPTGGGATSPDAFANVLKGVAIGSFGLLGLGLIAKALRD